MESEILFSEINILTEQLLNSKQDVSLRVGGYSMYPTLKPGDIITIRRTYIEDIKLGDIVVYRTEKKWIAHRIQQINSRFDKSEFITKGESCKKPDIPVPAKDIIGKVISFSRNGRLKNMNEKVRLKWENFPLNGPLIRLWIMLILLRKKIIKHTVSIYKNMVFLTLKSKKIFRWNLLFSLIIGFLPLLIIYLVKWLIDDISGLNLPSNNPRDYYSVFFIIGLIALAFLIQTLISIFNRIVHEKLSQSVSTYVFGLLHNKYTLLDMEYLEDAAQQDKIHRAVQEAGVRPNKMINQYLILWQSLVSWFFIAFLIFTIHWTVFFLIVIAVIPSFWIRIKFSRDLYHHSKTNSNKEREGFYYSRILTGLPFAKELRLFGLSNFFISKFETIQNELYDKKNRINSRQVLPDLTSQVFAVLLIFLSFGIVAFMAINGLITIGTMILFFLIFQRGYSIMKDLFQSFASLIEDNVFLQDFLDFVNLTSLRKISEPQELTNFQTKSIILENVSFQYPSSKRKALNSVSIEIPKGKTIALVGANGSGKTTLIKLLCGFYVPQKGRILFDNTDISLVDPEILRKQITAVFQDFALYNLTAIDNIFLGDISKPLAKDEIIKAARNAAIDDVLEKLPLSYQTMLGNLFDKGEGLSLGQWQKMALAKAFYRNSPILLLDEPSSVLDAETEKVLLQNLKLLAQNKTVVIVSHRFSTIKWADIIYVLDNGEVIESGIHEELLNQKGRYFEMYSSFNQ
jgi:ATP-binding cassette, subfamily B, bacterial